MAAQAPAMLRSPRGGAPLGFTPGARASRTSSSPRGGEQRPGRDVTLTVFMEGTANSIQKVVTQIALLSHICSSQPLPTDRVDDSMMRKPGQYKLSFEGCGVSHGVMGVLFAAGLREQCKIVRGYVLNWVQAGLGVWLNFVGLSRGGIGGLYLAQELNDLDTIHVLLNLLLFDPVPGNFIYVSRFLDLASMSNANQAMDISSVKNLGRVVVLYPHEPLPDVAVHAPLLCRFPWECHLEQDVILGCHQGALSLWPQADTCLAFARIRDFLTQAGTRINTQIGAAAQLDVPDATLAELLSYELRRTAPTTRATHAPEGGPRWIVRHSVGRFLNRTHFQLLCRLGLSSKVSAATDMQDDVPRFMLDFSAD